MNEVVDLSGSWSTLWGAVTGGGGRLGTALSVIGVIVLVCSIALYLWERARNRGGDGGRVLWGAVIGATLAAPGIIFPIALTIIDAIANAAISIFRATGIG